MKGLEQLSVMDGYPWYFDSDRGTHFIRHDIQDWAHERDIKWRFHLPYNSQGAEFIE